MVRVCEPALYRPQQVTPASQPRDSFWAEDQAPEGRRVDARVRRVRVRTAERRSHAARGVRVAGAGPAARPGGRAGIGRVSCLGGRQETPQVNRNVRAFTAQITVLADISTAPSAGPSTIPQWAKTPAAAGIATTL